MIMIILGQSIFADLWRFLAIFCGLCRSISIFTESLVSGYYDYYQWPCYYQDYYDYCPYQIFPDCCDYNCAPECYPSHFPTAKPPVPPPIEDKCTFSIPGWFEIQGRHIYLGQMEAQLSRFEAEAKAVEVGGNLLEIRSNNDKRILDAISNCKNL